MPDATDQLTAEEANDAAEPATDEREQQGRPRSQPHEVDGDSDPPGQLVTPHATTVGAA